MGANSSTPSGVQGEGESRTNTVSSAVGDDSRARAGSSELADVVAGVEMIRQLEAEHRQRLDTLTDKRKQLVQLLEDSKKLGTDSTDAQRKEIEETKKLNTTLYKEHMEEVNQKKDKELEDLIEHVNTNVLKERRQMMREDVFSSVRRDLDEAWQEGLDMMKKDQQQALATQTAISTATYKKKFDEFRMNLDAEYQEALKKKHAKRRKRGSGIFEWLSPNKRRRAGDDDEDEDD
jgi:hypothetical protein